MLENLRKKSLTKTYHDLNHQISFEQGHARFENTLSLESQKQRLSTEYTDHSFPHTLLGASNKLRLFQFSYQPKHLEWLYAEPEPAIEFNMIYCPMGSFTMGHGDQKDNPPRTETIKRPFLLGETEVTQELYEKVMGKNPSHYKGSQNPIEKIEWLGSISFCNTLSLLQGLDQCYTKNSKSLDFGWDCDFSKNGYRLPTEMEWEYAAKAGTDNLYAGTTHSDQLDNYAVRKSKTYPTKTKLPNEWGFYDMTGNVGEWCWEKYYAPNSAYEAHRVYRGGSFLDEGLSLTKRHAESFDDPKRRAYPYVGFRLCRSVVS